MSTILVTGGNGFVAAQVIIAAINKGFHVVSTVRTEEKAEQATNALTPRLGDKTPNLSFAIVPKIEAEHAFDEVIKANQFVAVLHTATPFHLHAKDPKEITGPAVGSTENILESIRSFGPSVKRVIITSSFASIVDPEKGYRPGYAYSEKDWNPITWEATHDGNPVHAYYGAKTWAEKSAWDFMKEKQPQFELVTICPPMVFGQVAQFMESADQLNTSSAGLYAVFSGQQKEFAPQGVMLFCNVIDVGISHVLAIDAPGAGNHRFLTCGDRPYTDKEISDAFIKHYPEIAPRVPTKLLGDVDQNGLPAGGYYTGDNSLSKRLLGMTYQNFEDTMVQFAESIKDLPPKSNKGSQSQ